MFDNFVYMLFLTLVPWIELRGSIPYGIYAGFDPILVLFSCVLVNILLLFPVFLFLDYVFPLIRNWKIADIVVRRTRKKSQKYVEKWGFLGLAIVVGIPLPGTGAYTGALAAHLFGFERKKAFQAISLGVMMAGIIILFLSFYSRQILSGLLSLP